MKYKNLVLDKFQEEAIAAIDRNNSVVVSAPTGSGKTLTADYIIDTYVKQGLRVIYTAPIKALSNQKFKEFSESYGPTKVGLLTGDVVINSRAELLIMTAEIYRNMVLTNDEVIKSTRYVIFDEIHYINDIERGYIWEESIIFSPSHIRFLCLSATIPNADEFSAWIGSIKDHKVITVKHTKRPVPLHMRFYDAEQGITTLEALKEIKSIPDYHEAMGRKRWRKPRAKAPNHVDLVKLIKHKVPCFFFYISRQGSQDSALELSKAGIFKINPKISEFVRNRLENAPQEISKLKSTIILRQTLPYGIAFHHAGLLPIIKETVEQLFGLGLINVLYTTETFAVGINMPAKTVCFKSLRKFDGVNFRFLNAKEYFQMAGRAGRRGIDKEGLVVSMIDNRDFDYPILKKMTTSDEDPLKSQFRLSANTVLNMVKHHKPDEIVKILKMSFFTFQSGSHSQIEHSYEKIKKNLVKFGYLADGKLTAKGQFASKIYCDELIIGEIFTSNIAKDLDEYQLLLIVACLCYEAKEKTEFYETYDSKKLNQVARIIFSHPYLKHEKRFQDMDLITALVFPCYKGGSIFDVLKKTNLLEGDLMRFFRQMIDRFSQIRNATDDYTLRQKTSSCQDIIQNALSGIDGL